MKIKSIAAICKKNKQVVLFNRYSDSGTISQYIGDGSAVYPISGLPELDEESILTIFDVPEKQREDWLVRYRDIPEGISFEDTDTTEKIIEQGNLSIVYSGKTLKPLQTRRGLVFIESRYLSPVSDVLDVLELYERVTPFGAPYIVAKAGFLLQAVIMPCDVISAQFVQRLQELTRQCAVSLDLREQERERHSCRSGGAGRPRKGTERRRAEARGRGGHDEAHCRRLRYSGHNRRRKTGRAGKRSKTAFRLVFGAEKGRIYRRAGVRAYQGITEKAAPHDGAAYPLYIIYRKDGFKMTTFEFMVAAFYALVGVVCLSVAVVIAYAVVVGIYRGLKGGGHRGRK